MKQRTILSVWRKQRGFTLIEVLIATVIIVLFLVPAVQALRDVTHAGTETQVYAERERALQDRMNTVLALPFETLASAAGNEGTASVYSDPTTSNPRTIVYISHFDGDATGNVIDAFDVNNVDPDLLWIQVAYANSNSGLVTVLRK